MAVSIDTVYQRVLALANKEQRGYITPQEFNLLANQAQMTIFESYFYTKNQRERLEDDSNNNSDSNISKLLDMKLRPFTSIAAMTSVGSGVWSYPANSYQIGKIYHNNFTCDMVSEDEFQRYFSSARHSSVEPIYSWATSAAGDVKIAQDRTMVTSDVTCESVTKPSAVTWGYVVISGNALLNSLTTTDFELHDSEEDTLVNKILEMAGIVMNKPGLVQIATQRDSSEQQIQNV